MAQSSDVQYVAYLKAKFNLADADLLQVISLSQRGGYTPTPEDQGLSDSPVTSSEEEKTEVDAMDASYEEIVEEEYDEVVEEYMDESLEEIENGDTSPTPAPAPAPMPLSNNDQIVEQSQALVPIDEAAADADYNPRDNRDMAASTLKMPETIAPTPKEKQSASMTQLAAVTVDEDSGPDDELNSKAIVPATSTDIVPATSTAIVPTTSTAMVPYDEELAMVPVTPPITDDLNDDEKQEENQALYVVACLILLFLIAAAVVLILIFVTGTIPKWWEEDLDPPPMGVYVPGDCNFARQVQPNVIGQCECTQQVSFIESSVQEQYDILVAEFIPTVYSDWNFATSSCEPENLALLWLSTGAVVTNSLDRLQRYTMAFLYYSTEGEQWTRDVSWLSEADVCTWYGLACTSENLARIQLLDNSVKGLIPMELALLTQLNTISLDNNKVKGPIPTDLYSMASLKTLTLDANEIEGSIPSGLGQATGLEVLRLGSNQFLGSVPTELYQMTMLKSLSFENNTITGRIPTEFGTFRNLESLSVSYTEIRAVIPTDYGLLTKLQELKVSNTLVGGVLPMEFAKLTDLKIIDFTSSRFRQGIPSFLGLLTDLNTLMLGNNTLKGEIPTHLGNLAKLQILNLHENELTGSMPTELGRLSALQNLTVYGNPFLTGNVPVDICELRDAKLVNFTSDCPTREYGVLCPIATCCTNCVPLVGDFAE